VSAPAHEVRGFAVEDWASAGTAIMGVPTVSQVRTWVGLDVHAAKVVAAIVDPRSGELRVQRLPGLTGTVVEFCAGLPRPVRVTYEAGPTGFGLARALERAGVGCVIAAPGKIARPASDRVKTDRRDAELLVRLLMAGQLSAVRVPSVREEACRDLVRAREDVRGDLMRARHRVGKLLLRHDQRFDGNNWTGAPRQWLDQVELADPIAQLVLLDSVGAVDALVVRRDALERQMAALVPDSPWAQTIGRLRCLRGVDTLTALGLAAEIGDFERFDRPAKLMSFLGLVPSEHSSGGQRRQGAITKSGSEHARRLLVEAAWHYRRRPSRGRELVRRQDGQPQHVCAISWQAQRRLHHTWQRLDAERGKRRTVVAVAVARELTGFCWAVVTAD
jgi:transposase